MKWHEFVLFFVGVVAIFALSVFLFWGLLWLVEVLPTP